MYYIRSKSYRMKQKLLSTNKKQTLDMSRIKLETLTLKSEEKNGKVAIIMSTNE